MVQFTTNDANQINDLIKPHQIPSMQYKLTLNIIDDIV